MDRIPTLLFIAICTAFFASTSLISKDYVPPEMPPYPRSKDEVMKALAPYYHDERPMDFFFEMYVSEIIEELPEDTSIALEAFSKEYPSFFEKSDGSWKGLVRESCKLSDTFEVAVMDLWIRNQDVAKDKGWTFHPRHFSQVLMENYFEDGSKVDIWEGDSLESAKQRIKEYKKS